MKRTEIDLGTLIETAAITVLMGNRYTTLEVLKKTFPHFQFSRMKQVHGDRVIEVPRALDLNEEADAQFTDVPGVALCSITADCLPIFLHFKSIATVAAIHAGWRGVEQRILPKTLAVFEKQKRPFDDLDVYVGPHIGPDSFEVDEIVKNQLLQSSPKASEKALSHSESGKSNINLFSLIQAQLHEYGVSDRQITHVIADTKTDTHFHSFRRDKEGAGRQISFVVLKNGGSRRN